MNINRRQEIARIIATVVAEHGLVIAKVVFGTVQSEFVYRTDITNLINPETSEDLKAWSKAWKQKHALEQMRLELEERWWRFWLKNRVDDYLVTYNPHDFVPVTVHNYGIKLIEGSQLYQDGSSVLERVAKQMDIPVSPVAGIWIPPEEEC